MENNPNKHGSSEIALLLESLMQRGATALEEKQKEKALRALAEKMLEGVMPLRTKCFIPKADKEELMSDIWKLLLQARQNQKFNNSDHGLASLRLQARNVVREYLRKHDSVSKDKRAWLKRLEKIKTDLRQKYRREPEEDELAEALNISLKDLQAQLSNIEWQTSIRRPMPFMHGTEGLYGAKDEEKQDGVYVGRNDAPVPPDQENWLIANKIAERVSEWFPDLRERTIVFGMLEGETQEEIGQRLNLSASMISHIWKNGLEERYEFMKAALTAEFE